MVGTLLVDPKPIGVIGHSTEQGSDGGNSEYESVDGEELGEEEEEEVVLEIVETTAEDTNKTLDDDEDRKNPQYIPKKGTFYEHDDRNIEELEEISREAKSPEEEKENEKKDDQQQKKKVWREDDKWQHDRFLYYDQAPKSKEELVAAYGYDIRNEEGPPRARRRRRYGRGPNKYTRNWEDFDAYSKPTRGVPLAGGGRGRGRRLGNINSEEDYPSLDPNDQKFKSKEDNLNNIPTMQVTAANVDTQRASNHIPHIVNENHKGPNSPREDTRRQQDPSSFRGGRPFTKRGGPRGGNKSIPRNVNNVNEGPPPNRNYDRRGGGRGSRGGGPPHSDRAKEVAEITEELKTITITPSHNKEDHFSKGKRGADRGRAMPPRMQDSMRGGRNKSPDLNGTSKPKRYSSQRQRPVQEQVVFQQSGSAFYEQNESGFAPALYEGSSDSPVSLPPSGPPAFVPPSFTSPPSYPPEPFLGRPQAPRMTTLVTQPHLIGPAGPIAPAPPVPVAGTATVATATPVTGPPFLPPENMINYAAGAPTLVPAPHPNPQFTAAAFQAFTPVSQTPPQEIYSNGTMYYNTQNQQFLPRINPTLHKRPKAAIPILPPPDQGEYPPGEYEEYEDGEEYDDSQEYPPEAQEEYQEYPPEAQEEQQETTFIPQQEERLPERSDIEEHQTTTPPPEEEEDYVVKVEESPSSVEPTTTVVENRSEVILNNSEQATPTHSSPPPTPPTQVNETIVTNEEEIEKKEEEVSSSAKADEEQKSVNVDVSLSEDGDVQCLTTPLSEEATSKSLIPDAT